MSELLEQCSVMISSTSSACVEAVAVGIPVDIHGNRSGATMNPIPSNVPKALWDIFYTPEQLANFLRTAVTTKERISIAHKLFQPVNAKGTRALFTCT